MDGASSSGSITTHPTHQTNPINSGSSSSSKRIGNKFTLDKKLGEGGYGSIFYTKDEHENALAVKKIEIDPKEGVDHPMEMSICSSFEHPYIQGAHKITFVDNKYICIVQDLAESDLSGFCREPEKYKTIPPHPVTNKICDSFLIRKWLFQIAAAVYCLHREKIIHADIKAANILLFSDNNIKLSDFSLSLKYLGFDYTHSSGTVTHRGPETFLKTEWNFNTDIWSLGITFYEITYGRLLFPHQSKDLKIDDEKLRKMTSKHRMYRCIKNFMKTRPDIQNRCHMPSYKVKNKDKKYPDKELVRQYIRAELHPDFIEGLQRNDSVANLIASMIVWPPKKRPVASAIITHALFLIEPYLTVPIYKISSSPSQAIHHEAEILNYIQPYLKANNIDHKSQVSSMTLSIYSRCKILLDEIRKNDKKGASRRLVAAIFMIACKIVEQRKPKLDFLDQELFALEQKVCSYLNFRLHHDRR